MPVRKDETGEFPSPLEPVSRWEKRWGVLIAIIVVIAAHLMWPDTAKAGIAPATVTVKHQRADRHQREMVWRVLRKCDRMKAPRKVLIASMATTTQESTTRNLAGGHGTSVGLFQIINLHGSWLQRHNPEWSAHWFCSRAINVNHHRPYLSVAGLAQAVQRSAHPSAYGQWTREAVRTYRLTMGRA